MQPVLWQPSTKRKANATINRFMDQVNAEFGVDVSDYESLYQWSIANPADFWTLLWDFAEIKASKKGHQVVLDQDKMRGAQWFPEARLNYAENLLKHCHEIPDRPALIFHGEQGNTRQIKYQELYHVVSKLARAFQHDGVIAGDRVAAVLPNTPEAVIAMLAATSLGAIWSSCSPDFGVAAIIDRFCQIKPKVLLICDGYSFNGKIYDRRAHIQPLLDQLPSVQKTVLVQYLDNDAIPPATKLTSWQDYLHLIPDNQAIKFRQMAFNDPLYILYSSGTTGPPKCIVHGIGGTLIQHIKEHLLHVDIHPEDRVFYFTTCGWMMWNWLVSALASAATLILYDGSPLYPKPEALIDLIDQYQINCFGVSAKYIDAIKKASVSVKQSHHLDSLQTILSTGSPLSPDSFDYVYQNIKSDVCMSSISGWYRYHFLFCAGLSDSACISG